MTSTSSYARLRGLPFTATEQEVAQWFAAAPGGPLSVLRVFFTFNAYGRKSGEAFVELPEKMAERAVQALNHRHLGSRYIEVFQASEAEASQASAAPNTAGAQTSGGWQAEGVLPPGSNGLIRLRGLPFNVTAEAVMQFFQGYPIPNGIMGVHLALGNNGRPNGEAFVEFGSEEIADAALAKDRATIGQRYVEVFRANPEQMHQSLSRANKSNNMAPVNMQAAMAQGGMAQGGMAQGGMAQGGMPQGGMPQGGMPQGGMPQGGMAGANGMPYAYGPFSAMPPAHMYGAAMNGGGMGGSPGLDSVVKMRGLPFKVTRNDILEFFAGLSVPLNGVHLMFNEREQPTGEAYVEFSSPEDRERAMTKDRQHMGGRYVELFRVGRAEMIQALEQFVGGYMNNNIPMQPGMAPAHPQYGMYGAMQQSPYGQPPAFMGAPACGAPQYGGMQQPMQTMPPAAMPNAAAGAAPGKASTLRMRGLPFRSTAEDVMRFFTGFHILPSGVVLGNKDGRPSGEAWVTFSSPSEAQRALLGMNHKNMGSRYVELFAAT